MLNYSVQVGDFAEEQPDFPSFNSGIGTNPFPGLRPFSIDESHVFFGREGQVDEILTKLSKNRSVTVIGYSGSGKSSLILCGLVPILHGGFMVNASPLWQVISIRPGNSPISNLTNAIVDHLIKQNRVEEKDRQIHKAIIQSVLRSGPDGLVEVAKYIQGKEADNVFILVDQFEELFRYRESNDEFANEAAAYVNLILTAVHQKETPIYLSINMRSDFIGECSVFPGLTQMVNESNYLVPQMTREQKRMAIEGPIAVGGGRISQRLVKRLLSDVGDHQDQLPILQHALMRTWDYWVDNREVGEPIDIRHYNSIGKITQALSLHANEAFDELNSREKEIAEILFKNITEKNQENQGLRRPCKIGLIAELAEASEKEVIQVVEQFRKPGRSFLMPGAHITLNADSNIELSHESLMRIWSRLFTWVDEEAESAQMYRRISEAAAMYQIGKTGLWRPPDLQLALNWQKKQKPTRTWAQRYDIAFERAIVFLDTSRITYEAELKNQEMMQRRMLRRARVTSVILGIAALIAVLFFVYGLTQQLQAEKQAVIAKEQEGQALKARDEATDAKEDAVLQKERAEDALQKNQELIKKLENTIKEVLLARAEAEKNLRLAEEQTKIAERQTSAANEQRGIAQNQYERAQAAYRESNRLLMLSIAQSMEAKVSTMEDKEMAGLLAMQGYLFHTQYEGKKYDTYVFAGLYSALEKLSGLNYNVARIPGNLINKMFAMVASKTGNAIYVTGNDGRIFQGDFIKQIIQTQISANPFSNRVLALSTDERYLVNGSDSSFIQVFDLSAPKTKPVQLSGHKSFVNDIKFLPDNSGFISASMDRSLRITNHLTGQSELLMNLPFSIKSFDISRDGRILVGASATGQLISVDLSGKNYKLIVDEAPNRILSVAFHSERNLVAYGTEIVNAQGLAKRGSVKLYDINQSKITKELGGHNAGVSDVEFSPNGFLLASAGYDRKLQMWVVDQEEDLPITMDSNNGSIWKIAFSGNSDYLLASCNNGEIRIWQTSSRMLAEQICPKLSRNMTIEEWKTYVGNDINYESTCKSLLINGF
jgi:ABC-type oligopeptide transport system ATPase subunit